MKQKLNVKCREEELKFLKGFGDIIMPKTKEKLCDLYVKRLLKRIEFIKAQIQSLQIGSKKKLIMPESVSTADTQIQGDKKCPK